MPQVATETIIERLETLRAAMIEAENARKSDPALSGDGSTGAANLVHYAAIRRFDLRELQHALAGLGLSGMQDVAYDTFGTVDRLLLNVKMLSGHVEPEYRQTGTPDWATKIVESRTTGIFGPSRAGRETRIMITLPEEAASDADLVRDLVAAGVDCVRINCAQGDRKAWNGMIRHVRKAEKEYGTTCRIMLDLAGPKMRTGPAIRGHRYLKIRPERNAKREVLRPARVWLAPQDVPPAAEERPGVHLPVDEEWLGHLHVDDRIRLRDRRGKKRNMRVTEVEEHGAWATLNKAAHIESGTVLEKRGTKEQRYRTEVGPLPRREDPVVLRQGATLVVQRSFKPARREERARDGSVKRPAEISCTLPEMMPSIRVGDRVEFDDAKAGGIVERVDDAGIHVRIERADAGGIKLNAGKSINFPDTATDLSPLTEKDLEDLDFIIAHADMVGASYFRRSADLALLQNELDARGAGQLGILLKIENREAFEAMEELFLTLLRSERIGVIIARGDLATSCGLENIASVQNAILRFCTAARIPALVATQVLENMTKNGAPTRAEIVDATVAAQAQCILLGKGRHVTASIALLDRLLKRMVRQRPTLHTGLDRLNPDALFSSSLCEQ